MTTVNEILSVAKSWVGKKEADGSHKSIIDLYNSHKPLARGYSVKYTDSWCATFITALAIKCGATDIIPKECGCGEMIKLCQTMGIFVENENRTPNAGDIIFYDWQDDGKGDNKGWSDHVGIVEKVSGKAITVIEGNYNDCVGRRVIEINARYIRGYAVPRYKVEKKTVSIELNELSKGSKGDEVKSLQALLSMRGYTCGSCGIDGDFGSATDSAVKMFQKGKGLTVDGIVGKNTWNKLLK